MFSLVYVSRATENFSLGQLADMMMTFQAKNLRVNVTGLLLYKDGNFMQLLEGEQHVVLELYGKIRRDSRHTNVITLIDEPMAAQTFPDWSMGFKNLDLIKTSEVPGYSDFLDTPLVEEAFKEDPSRALVMLNLFKTV